jgi:hypothetical protein
VFCPINLSHYSTLAVAPAYLFRSRSTDDQSTRTRDEDRVAALLCIVLTSKPPGKGYVRHGTTTLFAALDISTGEVLTQCPRRHRHREFLRFLKRIDASILPSLDVHLVLDNYTAHKYPKVRAWPYGHATICTSR